jgi:hypothetical protein
MCNDRMFFFIFFCSRICSGPPTNVLTIFRFDFMICLRLINDCNFKGDDDQERNLQEISIPAHFIYNDAYLKKSLLLIHNRNIYVEMRTIPVRTVSNHFRCEVFVPLSIGSYYFHSKFLVKE